MKVQRVTNMAPPPALFLVISILSLVILTNAELISEFTCGHLYYRTLYLDKAKDILYVGAMDKLIKVQNLKNISTTNCQKDAMDLKASNIPNCISRGKSKNYDCRNHIRVIQPIGPDGSRLYVCGTNAHNPKDEVIYANLTHLARQVLFWIMYPTTYLVGWVIQKRSYIVLEVSNLFILKMIISSKHIAFLDISSIMT